MKLDTAIFDYDLNTVAEQARRAEALGYDCLWTSETQHDPFLPLAVAATATSKIQLGTAIAVAFPRSPMVLAYTAWDLQKASGGRFVLGLGSQVKAHNVRRFSVPFESPGPKLREIVLALRAIWDSWQNGAQNGTKLNFQGEFYKFDLMTPFFQPEPLESAEQARIPVYIAAVNQLMCKIAGEVCDGIHVHPLHTPKYLCEYVHPAVAEGLRISGRQRSEIEFVSSTFVVLGESEAERSRNEAAVRQQIAFYASTRTYEPVLAAHGWEGLLPELHARSLRGDWAGMTGLITDEMMSEFAVSGVGGDFASLGRKLRERYGDLLDRTALYMPYPVKIADEDARALIAGVRG